jgi:hypothetical protein
MCIFKMMKQCSIAAKPPSVPIRPPTKLFVAGSKMRISKLDINTMRATNVSKKVLQVFEFQNRSCTRIPWFVVDVSNVVTGDVKA